jgi:hypothetical protein
MNFQEKTEARFKLGAHLAENFLAQKPWANLSPEADVTFEAIMLFFFCKSYKTYQAIAVLWHAGFYEDAWLLTRTLFEIWMQAAYLRKEPRERARQFQKHDPIRMYRAYLKLKEHGENKLAVAFEARADFAEIQSQYDHSGTTKQRQNNWFGKSISSLARELGPDFKKHYLVDYWWQSNLVHSAGTSMQHYVTDSLELDCRPGKTEPGLDAKIAPKSATAYFISSTEEISEALSIDLQADVQLAWAGLQALDAVSETAA